MGLSFVMNLLLCCISGHMAIMHDASPAMMHLLQVCYHARAAFAALLLTKATVVHATADGHWGVAAPTACLPLPTACKLLPCPSRVWHFDADQDLCGSCC